MAVGPGSRPGASGKQLLSLMSPGRTLSGFRCARRRSTTLDHAHPGYTSACRNIRVIRHRTNEKGRRNRRPPCCRILRSGFLRRVRYAPTLGVHGFPGEQLARPAPGRATGVELAIGAVVAGLVLRVGRLGVVFHVIQRLGGRVGIAEPSPERAQSPPMRRSSPPRPSPERGTSPRNPRPRTSPGSAAAGTTRGSPTSTPTAWASRRR